MAAEERDVVIGVAKVDGAFRKLSLVPGCALFQCSRCAEETWIAPASFCKLEEGALVVCTHCITDEEWKAAEVTDAVKKEAAAWLNREAN